MQLKEGIRIEVGDPVCKRLEYDELTFYIGRIYTKYKTKGLDTIIKELLDKKVEKSGEKELWIYYRSFIDGSTIVDVKQRILYFNTDVFLVAKPISSIVAVEKLIKQCQLIFQSAEQFYNHWL